MNIKRSHESNKEILKKTDKEVLEYIKNFLIENNVYSLGKYKHLGFINFNTIKTRFKIQYWRELISMLNLQEEHRKALIKPKKEKVESKFKKNIVDISNDELIEIYKKFSESIGAKNGASMSQMKKLNFPYSQTVYLRRFGSWKDFKTLCGYEFKLGTFYTKEEISKNLLIARKKLGRRLSQNEINRDKTLPSLETIIKFFKTTKLSQVWDELEKNLDKTTTVKTFSLDEIKNLLLEEFHKKGRTLTVKEIKENENLPGISTIYRKFETTKIVTIWEKILKDFKV